MTYISLNSILVNGRTLDSNDDITDLAKHINDGGLQVPILIDRNYRLLDGLRRLEAHRALGRLVIETEVVSNSIELIAGLRKAIQHGILAVPIATYRRKWELYRTALAMRSQTRSLLLRGKPRYTSVQYSITDDMSEILGLTRPAMHAFVNLFRMQGREGVDQEKVQEAIALLEAGQLTLHAAIGYVRRSTEVVGRINNLAEQRLALQSFQASLNGLEHVIEQMGRLNPRIPKEEVTQYLATMARFRSRLSRFIRTYTEENNKR